MPSSIRCPKTLRRARCLRDSRCFTIQAFSWDLLSVISRKAKAEPVAVETRKNVKMYVEHFLSRGLTVGQKEVDAVSPEARPSNSSRKSFSDAEQMSAHGRLELREVWRVRDGNDQKVARRDGSDVHERHASVVTMHDARWRVSCHDVTEDAALHERCGERIRRGRSRGKTSDGLRDLPPGNVARVAPPRSQRESLHLRISPVQNVDRDCSRRRARHR
jgi:hypothetical protein